MNDRNLPATPRPMDRAFPKDPTDEPERLDCKQSLDGSVVVCETGVEGAWLKMDRENSLGVSLR